MIEIIGFEGTHEYRVATAIREAFIAYWPGIEKSPASEEHLKIAANTKLAGYQVSDVDIVVGAVFHRARYFAARKPIKDRDGNTVSGVKVRVQNFFAAVEVKSQDGDGVSVIGNEVSVRYGGKWKSATDQNVKQVHALVKYFSDQRLDLWIYRCLALDGINELPVSGGIPLPEAGAIPSSFTASEFLAAIAGVNGLNKWRGEYTVSSGLPDVARRALEASIFKQLVPSQLDRSRMDRIAARRDEASELAKLLGKERVHLRGHGGTGKTVMMMQAAHAAYEQHGRRCLVLTYNIALAADIQRLLALLGVPSSAEGGGVEVKTTMSFVYSWLGRLGIVQPDAEQSSFEDYVRYCGECGNMIEGDAISRDDIQKLIDADPEAFAFDAIIVDEAQDWPQPEARLLAALYGGEKISIADGREQLLRGLPTDWSKTLPTGQLSTERSLNRCLRMKKNLGVFANTVAQLAGLNWQVEPNNEAAGGKVIIVDGNYASIRGLVEGLVEAAKKSGNEKVDFLHCVPPRNVVDLDGRRASKLAMALEELGHKSWDAVDLATRRDFPRSTDVFRIVQYDSCRGLEGWTTVLEDFEEAWSWRYQRESEEIGKDAQRTGMDPDRAARLAAWRWSMIALTRPIDTLVICLHGTSGPVPALLLDAARRNGDFAEIVS